VCRRPADRQRKNPIRQFSSHGHRRPRPFLLDCFEVSSDLFELTRLEPVDVVGADVDAGVVAAYIAKRTPLVIKGGASAHEATRRWSIDYFTSCLDTVKVQKQQEDGTYHYRGFERVPFSDFARSLTTTKNLYLTVDPVLGEQGIPITDSSLACLAPDMPLPPYIERPKISSGNLWIGPGDNRSLLHYDPKHSFILIVQGKKRVALYNGTETARLRPYGFLDAKAALTGRLLDSKINASRVQGRYRAALSAVAGLEANIGPGDVLFIPCGTWHYVESSELNIAINYFVRPQLKLIEKLRRPMLDHALKVKLIIQPYERGKRLATKLRGH
jgi:hypothetical protein